MSKYYNFTKFCYLCNSNKSHTLHNVTIQQPLITTICVNRFHQSRTGRLTKNTAYILCNSSISLTDFEGQLISLILYKDFSTNKTTTFPWLKLVTFGLSVMMLKSLKLSLTISLTLILYICYFTKEEHDGNI